MAKTDIDWTDEVWNPTTGCTKISEGCANCYAEKMHNRLRLMYSPKYQQDFNKVTFHPEELNRNFGKKPKMIFVNSMSDLFHEDVPDNFICDVLSTCFCHTKHTFQILTKRSERLFDFGYRNIPSFLPTNIWLGVSVELAKYKNRIDDLRKTDAKVKFLSCEPLLGDLGELDLTGIDWVIVGGESGSNARPMHPDWVRNIQRQCQEQGVVFFFKQWGGWKPVCEFYTYDDGKDYSDCEVLFSDGWLWSNEISKSQPFQPQPERKPYFIKKVGKKKAGCLLDGKEYKEFPKGGVI